MILKDEYLDARLHYHSYWKLTVPEKRFIKDLLLLIDRYINYVLIEDEYNTITMARLISLCPIRPNGKSPFVSFVEDAIENKEEGLKQEEINILSNLLDKIRPVFCQDNILIAAQTILLDSMFNPECTEAVSNLLNLTVLRCNTRGEQTDGLDALFCDDNYLSYVIPEFSDRSEMLMRQRDETRTQDDLFDYVMNKWDMLPCDLQKKTKDYVLEFCLTNELYGETSSLRKMGSTHISERRIRVWFERNKVSIDLAFFHEMGHVADYVYGHGWLLSKEDKAWEIIFEAEKDLYWESKMQASPALKRFHDYAVSCTAEYFACSFSDYVQEPDWLRDVAPNTYYYLDTLLKNE